MVILRPTRKLRTLLPVNGPTARRSDTALGDWYVSRLFVGPHPLLLLVSSTSLLPILVPARAVRSLPGRLASMVAERHARCGIAPTTIAAEQAAMAEVVIGPTVDRSVLGIMVDCRKSVSYFLDSGGWDEAALWAAEAQLAETPCFAGRRAVETIFPETKAPELLRAKWGTG